MWDCSPVRWSIADWFWIWNSYSAAKFALKRNTSHPIRSTSLVSLFMSCVLVSWCFEPSQPWRISWGLKTNFSVSNSRLFISRVIIPKVSFAQTTTQTLFTISEYKPRKTITQYVWEPIFIPLAFDPGTRVEQGDLFYSAGLQLTGKTTRERLWKECSWMDRKSGNYQGRNPWQ